MNELRVTGNMKVKNFKEQFNKAFGLHVRVYEGTAHADGEKTLASIRAKDSDASGGSLDVYMNTRVGNLEKKIKELYGVRIQIALGDDSRLAEDGDTLAAAREK